MFSANIILTMASILIGAVRSQDSQILINQGTIVGLQIFPETSTSAVYRFLGIPYAQPPIGDGRFAPPRPHSGWNHSYHAKDWKPMCPQPRNSIYDETGERLIARPPVTDENCLYLNIWTPQDGLRFGHLPVLVIITGEEMTFDWSQNRPTGLDLAAEGVVVVTVQYRSNIFGWLALNSAELPGNYGLDDQKLALQWIQQNINKFGGNPQQVTLLGHGTTGAVCAMAHMVSMYQKQPYFSKAIIMSGNIFSYNNFGSSSVKNISKILIRKLSCESSNMSEVMKCLRERSTGDLQQAFESIYSTENFTMSLGPIVQSYAQENRNSYEKILSEDPQDAFRVGRYKNIPILIGICSNEGAFSHDYWIDLARRSYTVFEKYINSTVIPHLLEKYSIMDVQHPHLLKAIKWKYFEQYPKTTSYLLNSLFRLISEAEFESTFYETLELMAHNLAEPTKGGLEDTATLYAYSFQQGNSMDMRGKINLFGGAAHSSDLPLIMGPSLFQQISRRRFTVSEEKLCRKLRQMLTDFMKTGNPTPGRTLDAWQTFTIDRKFIKVLGERLEKGKLPISLFDINLPAINELLRKKSISDSRDGRTYFNTNPYTLNPDSDLSDSRSDKGSSSYLSNRQNFEYFAHLKNVYPFWRNILPSIYSSPWSENTLVSNNSLEHNSKDVLILDSDSLKYKHAFFSMLTMVCILLAILGLCVYILRKNHTRAGGVSL